LEIWEFEDLEMIFRVAIPENGSFPENQFYYKGINRFNESETAARYFIC